MGCVRGTKLGAQIRPQSGALGGLCFESSGRGKEAAFQGDKEIPNEDGWLMSDEMKGAIRFVAQSGRGSSALSIWWWLGGKNGSDRKDCGRPVYVVVIKFDD